MSKGRGFVRTGCTRKWVVVLVILLPLASREHPSDSRTYGPAYATLDPRPR